MPWYGAVEFFSVAKIDKTETHNFKRRLESGIWCYPRVLQ
jgi:hypothetical protein